MGEPAFKFFAIGNNARGFIAVGNLASGVVAIGNCAYGVVAIGVSLAVGPIAIGLNAFGGLLAIGLNAVGLCALSPINGIGNFVFAGVNAWGASGRGGVNWSPSLVPAFLVAVISVVWAFIRPFRFSERAQRSPGVELSLADVAAGRALNGWLKARLERVSGDVIEARVGHRAVRLPGSPKAREQASRALADAKRHPTVWLGIEGTDVPPDAAGGYRDPARPARIPICDAIEPLDASSERRVLADRIFDTALGVAAVSNGLALVWRLVG